MMPETVFFRLLKTPIDDKGDILTNQVTELNATSNARETFILDPAGLSLIPGSPFAYWASKGFLALFEKGSNFESNDRVARVGLSTSDDFRFLRAFWEVSPSSIAHSKDETLETGRWIFFCKGGLFSPYYSDLHLVLNWQNNGQDLKEFIRSKGDSPSRSIRSESLYFLPGLTWPLRASSFAPYALPRGCIFGVRGYAVLAPIEQLPMLLGILNSKPFDFLFKFCLGRAGFPEFVVGVLQKLPWVEPSAKNTRTISNLAMDCYAIQRDLDCSDEVTHAFCLPGLVSCIGNSLLEGSLTLEAETRVTQDRLTAIQAKIDDLVFDLYRLDEADRALVHTEMGIERQEAQDADGEEDAEAENQEPTPPEDLPTRVQNLLMWCVGAAFGRWDARKALDPGLLPQLGGPFDPLPRCAPSALVTAEGLPASRDEVGDYPLSIAWDGILVDDPTHPSDVVAHVRQVLALLWGERADAIEREACQILGFKALRDYFRDPRKGFFSFHIKRYSKSRRKAPIYWLLQSEKRGYALWLYHHRLDKASLYTAGRTYADAKVMLEEARLEELRGGLDALEGTARRREAEIERQGRLVAEVTAFRDRLDAVALLNLPPDLNDGVVIGIAPLWELVPWKEAGRTWQKLVAGEYTWSTMSRQMRERGLIE